MRILLTGATGHLGRNLVISLLRSGHEVVASVRRVDPTLDRRVRQVSGDLLDPASLQRAGRGCDATVHCAALYVDDPRRAREMTRVATLGTRHVLDAAAANGHRRVLLTSSMVTVGFSERRDEVRDETQFSEQTAHPYFRAKVDAERAAWRHAEALGLPIVVLCPGGLIGPLDHRGTPTMQFLADLVSGEAQTLRGGVNYVDVRDVADATTRALTDAPSNARYLLTGECLPMRELGLVLRTLTGTRPVHLPLPRRVVLAVARVLQPQRYPMARESVGRWPRFSAARARRDLDFHPRPVEDSLADALRWLARTGAVHPACVAQWAGRLDPQGAMFAPRGLTCLPSTTLPSTPSANKVTPLPMPWSRQRTPRARERSVG